MNTFLPYLNFTKSAYVLDNKRLGKQRVECLQILQVLVGRSTGWRNHPAVKMWSTSPWWLVLYGVAVCREWRGRGYRDTCQDKMLELAVDLDTSAPPPNWLGNEPFHLSHRSNLLRKNPGHYYQYWPEVSPDLPYIWPTAR